ncbi:hypothetical protein [Ruminiclostridium cellobioparum]|jgi:hypothetical protein|uniref:hypothetical protein n=1 Tax=Ruminiclostridium cellobioparum TaxID=29355 RepID=UPI0004866CEF|nr:hypothetical protein [Ruminiclostridium cellobioparum]
MGIVTIIIAVAALLTLLSTLICGLWIRAKGLRDPGSLNFHMKIGITAVISTVLAIILLLIQ